MRKEFSPRITKSLPSEETEMFGLGTCLDWKREVCKARSSTYKVGVELVGGSRYVLSWVPPSKHVLPL